MESEPRKGAPVDRLKLVHSRDFTAEAFAAMAMILEDVPAGDRPAVVAALAEMVEG